MICALYTIKKKYRDKKIYIWDINADSIIVFTRAAFRGINIAGFATSHEKYVGEVYMNRPVVALKQVEIDEESIILASDEAKKNPNNSFLEGKVIYWSDVLEINDELKGARIAVYGIGVGAERLCEILDQEKLEVELYCVTNKEHGMWHKGKRVINYNELVDQEDYSVIVSVIKNRYKWEILEKLSDFQGQVYIDIEQISNPDADMTRIIQDLDFAVKNRKKIYLYSQKNLMGKMLEEILCIYGITIAGYVYGEKNKEEDIESIYELAFDGVEDKLIIINEGIPEDFVRARENIELAGFSLEKSSYTSLQRYTMRTEYMLSQWITRRDPLVGGIILHQEDRPGWKIYGKEQIDRMRILVLGGSTSSEELHPENWVSKLYYKLYKNDIKVTIYNGAHSGNDIVTEILRVLRDGFYLKPQIVVSMSGVNNLVRKDSVNQFNEDRMLQLFNFLLGDGAYSCGVPNDELPYSFWCRNVRMLKLISEFYGAKFLSFLQPMNMAMENMSLLERSLYGTEADIKEFVQSVNDDDVYINLLRLFEHCDEMYIDTCHYTDKAHAIIADIVYDAIISIIKRG